MVSWQKHRLHSQVPLMARDCPRRPWKAAGEGGHHLPLLVKAILQASSWYNHSIPVMYQYIAGPCWLYMLCSFFF
ncbi:unnamed protein product, partial [Staurois parvus]